MAERRDDAPLPPRQQPSRRARVGVPALLSQHASAMTDWCIAAALASLVTLTHDVGYLLRQPYWLDESWVALSTRLPWRDVPLAASVSPLGWTVLLRLAPGSGLQRQRLVPLVFAALAVACAYALVRSAGFGRILSALGGGVAVLCSPALSMHDDLKQYTADAAVTILLLVLLSRLEREWTSRRLLALAACTALAPLLSTGAVFVATAVVVALAAMGVNQSHRRWAWAAALSALVVMISIVASTTRRNMVDAMSLYWTASYLDRSPGVAAHQVVERARLLTAYAGVPRLSLLAALTLLGVCALAMRGRPLTALVVPAAFLGEVVAGMAGLYPVLDQRTSTWLLVTTDLLMGIGVLAAATALGAQVRVAARPLWPLRQLVVAAVIVVALGAYSREARLFVGLQPLFPQDVGAQVSYVRAHAAADDVIVVTLSANWGYAYYARDMPVRAIKDPRVSTGFVADLSADPRVLAMRERGPNAVRAAMREAVDRASSHNAAVWVVRTQETAEEHPVWQLLAATCGLRTVPVGVDPLLTASAADLRTHRC